MKRNAMLKSKKVRIILMVLCILTLLVVFSLYRAFGTRFSVGTTFGGVDVAGMTPVQAQKALVLALEDTLYRQPLQVLLPEETLTLSAEDFGVQISTRRALFDYLHASPDASGSVSLRPYLKAKEDVIYRALEDYAKRFDTVLTQPSWHLEGDSPNLSTEHFDPNSSGQSLVLTMGTPELHLEIETVQEQILLAFSQAVKLCLENCYQISPAVIPEAIPETPNPDTIARELETAPANDTVDRNTFSFVPGSYGTAIDKTLLAETIQDAVFGETVTVPLYYPAPDILGEEAYFQDVLGAYETRHTDNKNRNHNLQLQCDTLNGYILQPGETFSMNEVLGERTVERGYKPAPAYSGNRLVNSPGGGVCQGSTTLYNCVLLADLEVVFRACHGAKVGYVPLGLDCAINYLTTDFQFRNNFTCPIQIKAWMEGGYMKMQILGTDEKDYYIKMETGSGEDDVAIYARSFKCKYDKETNELISRDVEAYSTYYKDIG